MTKSFYLDTCIWRDFYEERFSKSERPLGKYAAQLFMKILKRKDKIFFSESVIWELRRDYDDKDINDMLALLFFNNVLIRVDITKEERTEAKILLIQRDYLSLTVYMQYRQETTMPLWCLRMNILSKAFQM